MKTQVHGKGGQHTGEKDKGGDWKPVPGPIFKQNHGFELPAVPVVERDVFPRGYGRERPRDIGQFSPFEIKYFDSA